jgi:apolipoprotein N-acyltransferase
MGFVCVFLLSLILAEWPAVVAWGTAAVAPAGSGVRFAAFAILWAAAEHARSIVYGGFPWHLTGWALARRPIWIQTASVWGVYGLGLAVVAVSAILAAYAVTRRLRLFGAAAALVLVCGAAGAWALRSPSRRSHATSSPAATGVAEFRKIRVALIQPNVREEDRRTSESAGAAYASTLSRGFDAAATGVDLIVFPESAFPFYWDASPRLRADLTRLAQRCGCAVLFNDITVTVTGGGPQRVFNTARIVTPAGIVPDIYRKVHLVPFGEYVPLPRLFFFVRQISQEIGEFTPADRPVVLRAGPLAVGVGICYEILYPELARLQTAGGANLLATISNDSWYGKAGAQEQHFAGAILRAVEDGRFLVRSAITGVSGVADSHGRILAELPAGRAGTLFATVSLEERATAWVRWGHGLPLAGDAAAAGVLLFGLVRWLRERRDRRGAGGASAQAA